MNNFAEMMRPSTTNVEHKRKPSGTSRQPSWNQIKINSKNFKDMIHKASMKRHLSKIARFMPKKITPVQREIASSIRRAITFKTPQPTQPESLPNQSRSTWHHTLREKSNTPTLKRQNNKVAEMRQPSPTTFNGNWRSDATKTQQSRNETKKRSKNFETNFRIRKNSSKLHLSIITRLLQITNYNNRRVYKTTYSCRIDMPQQKNIFGKPPQPLIPKLKN